MKYALRPNPSAALQPGIEPAVASGGEPVRAEGWHGRTIFTFADKMI